MNYCLPLYQIVTAMTAGSGRHSNKIQINVGIFLPYCLNIQVRKSFKQSTDVIKFSAEIALKLNKNKMNLLTFFLPAVVPKVFPDTLKEIPVGIIYQACCFV